MVGIDLRGVPKGEVPREVTPMMAKLAKGAFNDNEWIFEPKWDGYRAIAQIENNGVFLYSRNHISFNESFSALVNDLKKFKYDVVLDGEITVVDEKGVPHFQDIQNYKTTGEGQLVYYVFDILYLEGFLLVDLPLIKRKEILKNILKETQLIKYSDHVERDGVKFFELAKSIGLEGIMAKKKDSPYSMKRSDYWQKIKAKNRQEAVIAGFTEGRKSRKYFGALVLGAYKKGELVYLGHTGTGFSEQTLNELSKKMKPLIQKEPPFNQVPKTNMPVTWLRPKLVAEIDFQEWTSDNVMRQPVFLGLREDKEPKEVILEKYE